jgi:hypothetical protein
MEVIGGLVIIGIVLLWLFQRDSDRRRVRQLDDLLGTSIEKNITLLSTPMDYTLWDRAKALHPDDPASAREEYDRLILAKHGRGSGWWSRLFG